MLLNIIILYTEPVQLSFELVNYLESFVSNQKVSLYLFGGTQYIIQELADKGLGRLTPDFGLRFC